MSQHVEVTDHWPFYCWPSPWRRGTRLPPRPPIRAAGRPPRRTSRRRTKATRRDGAEKKEEAKDKKGHSYREKLEARGKKAAPAKPEKKPKYKKWKEVLEDATAQEGLFKVWTKREDVFFELGEQNLDKPYLALLSLSKGIGARFVLGGLPITDVMFDFHRVEDHVQIRMLNTLFRATDDPELMKAIELSYGNSILAQLPIESENEKDKTILVNMNEFFLSDISDIGILPPARAEQAGAARHEEDRCTERSRRSRRTSRSTRFSRIRRWTARGSGCRRCPTTALWKSACSTASTSFPPSR